MAFGIGGWRKGKLASVGGSGSSDFRSSHSSRREQEEAEERFSLEEYRHRVSAFGAQRPGNPADFDPHEAKGVRAEFGKPTDEDIRTWGNWVNVTLLGEGEDVTTPAQQLVHVSRRRPTSFNILTVVNFGLGWRGASDACNLLITYTVGVGQAQMTFTKTIAIATPEPGGSVFNTDQFPLNAVQGYAQLLTGALLTSATYQATIGQFAAPVFE
jgi:hypothetical protein